jgi:SAM-dependent methyltransferase
MAATSFVLDEGGETVRVESVNGSKEYPPAAFRKYIGRSGSRRFVYKLLGYLPLFLHRKPVNFETRGHCPDLMSARWSEFPHIPQRERGLMIRAGECLHLPPLTVPSEPILWMRCLRAIPRVSDDGLDVEVWWGCDGGEKQLLMTQRLDNAQTSASLRELTIELPLPVGRLLQMEVRCGVGSLRHGAEDWLGLLGLVICARGEFDLLRARTHHAWRLKNEIAHFSQVYSGDFYRDRHIDRRVSVDGSSPARALPPRPVNHAAEAVMSGALRVRLREVQPVAGENAFSYANRMLAMAIPLQAPDFPGRLRAMSERNAGRPLRMLALCAGEAAIEGGILAAANVAVELCIVDVNTGLLDQAVMHMPAMVTVDRVLGDANDIGPQLGQFDVVNITSGLHHLIELERVLTAIAEILSPGGEFWLIGEQVGRNGNRLWPEALEIANRIFSAWPADKRRNRNTGNVDATIPDVDFSAGCFEGIRSQDIIDQLDRHFLPVSCYLRNAFLWRLTDVAYAGNFNLDDSGDRELLVEAAVQEAMHWAQGGRCTEMHAVYKSKWEGMCALVGIKDDVRTVMLRA